MAEGRRRVHDRFGVVLEPEVQILGEVRLARGLGAVKRLRNAIVLVVLVILAGAAFQVLLRR